MAGKKVKKKNEPPSGMDRSRFNMKLVTSDVCAACKQQCARGIRYLDQMSVPGSQGNGVPCILTRGKAYK